MKKSWNLIIALILTAVLLISCGETTTKETPSQRSETNNTSINKENNSMKKDEDKEEVKENDEVISLEKGYYGTFKITKYIPTGAVEGFGRNSVNDYIGEEISINQEQVTTSGGNIKNPNYKEVIMNEDEFYVNYKVKFKSMEVSDKTITIVDVSNYNITDKYGDKIGANIIIAGNDRYYTLISGALFQITKVS